jgi:NAD(P)H-flavin reductase
MSLHLRLKQSLWRSLSLGFLASRAFGTKVVATTNSRSGPAAAARVADGICNFTLTDKWPTTHDSFVLRFSLPPDMPTLGDHLPAPTGVKLVLPSDDNSSTDVSNSTPLLVEKSYSPITHEDTQGYFDLLVKAYEPQSGGGFGAFLCNLLPGEQAPMKIKKARKIHGQTGIGRRWRSLTMIGGGTGVAPFVQIIRSILADKGDLTKLRLISVHKREEDILMKYELNELAFQFPDQLTVTHILTEASSDWKGLTGRGSVDLARQLIPSPEREEEFNEIACAADDQTTYEAANQLCEPKREGRARSMVMVCGKDEFVEFWAGALTRIPASPGVKKQKLQGPVGGFLKQLGYDEQQVFKF